MVGWSIVPMHRGCRSNPWLGHIQEAANGCINNWGNKSMFLACSPSLSKIHKYFFFAKLAFLKSHILYFSIYPISSSQSSSPLISSPRHIPWILGPRGFMGSFIRLLLMGKAVISHSKAAAFLRWHCPRANNKVSFFLRVPPRKA